MGEAPYVGAYCIRPTNGPGRGQVRRKRSREETSYVGRKSIRPTNGPDRGQTRVGGFLLFFYQEKKRRQKKIKASGTPAKFTGYGMCLCGVPGHFSQPRQGPSGTPAKFAGYRQGLRMCSAP